MQKELITYFSLKVLGFFYLLILLPVRNGTAHINGTSIYLHIMTQIGLHGNGKITKSIVSDVLLINASYMHALILHSTLTEFGSTDDTNQSISAFLLIISFQATN